MLAAPWRCRVQVLAYAAWQCGGGYAELTERVPLLHCDFQGPVTSLTGAVVEAPAVQQGTCHAVLLWMDYDLNPEGSLLVTPLAWPLKNLCQNSLMLVS